MAERFEQTTKVSAPSPDKSGLAAFASHAFDSFKYDLLQSPVTGITQLADHVIGSDLQSQTRMFSAPVASKFATAAWAGDLAGGIVATGVQLSILNRLVGVGAADDLQAKNYGAGTMRAVANSNLTGLLVGGLLTPVNDKSSGDFWAQRMHSAGITGLTFSALTAGSIGMKSLGNPVLSNGIVANALAGIPAGLLNADVNSLTTNGRFASGEERLESIADYSIGGAMAGGTHALREYYEPTSRAGKEALNQRRALNSLAQLYQDDPIVTARLRELGKGSMDFVGVKDWLQSHNSQMSNELVAKLIRGGASADDLEASNLYGAMRAERELKLAQKAKQARDAAPPGKSDWEVLKDNGIELAPLDQLRIPTEPFTSLLDGKFVPSEMQWRQLKALDSKSELARAYQQKVEHGEALPLDDIEPKQISQLRALRKEWGIDTDQNVVATMSARTLDEHIQALQSQTDLDKEGYGLNIGAGAWQGEAKEMIDRGYKSRAISIDKRAALPLQVDLQDVYSQDKQMIPGVYMSPEELRVYGRLYPDSMTVAGDATQLPIKSDSMKWVWGLYSVPFYLEDSAQVNSMLSEANRVLEPGAFGRFFPVRADQLATVKNWFQTAGIEADIKHTGNYGYGIYDRPKGYLLSWQKPQ